MTFYETHVVTTKKQGEKTSNNSSLAPDKFWGLSGFALF
jgi:hypothetical protein